MIDNAVTLLPEPDSPTIATVSRGATSNEMPFTTVFHTPSTRNDVVRLWTASTGPAAVMPFARQCIGRCRAGDTATDDDYSAHRPIPRHLTIARP